MKTLTEVQNHFKGTFVVPSWYNDNIHAHTMQVLKNEGKLYAVKYLKETFKELYEMYGDGIQELYLKEAKMICDFIGDQSEPTTIIKATLLDQTIAFVQKAVHEQGNIPLDNSPQRSAEQYQEFLESEKLLAQLKSLQTTLSYGRV